MHQRDARAADLRKTEDPTLDQAGKVAASAMLRGARGNSGVILSLLFRGISKRLKGEEECDGRLWAKALQEGDFDRFLTLVNRSGQSSFQALGNVWIPMEGADQGAAVALNLAANLLNGAGACRIHGGGFGGTTQNFVPNDKVEEFRSVMESVFGEGACMVLSIRPVGPVKVL